VAEPPQTQLSGGEAVGVQEVGHGREPLIALGLGLLALGRVVEGRLDERLGEKGGRGNETRREGCVPFQR